MSSTCGSLGPHHARCEIRRGHVGSHAGTRGMGDMEIEHRPHWDDDLIEAVIDLQYHCVDCMEDDYPDIDPRNHDAVNAAWAYEVIAAVEDHLKDYWKHEGDHA